MMVLFVSQCEKNALKKTRRVLDSFANRIGGNTWQTIITKEGLEAVKKLLRKTASKSTAVSCHWIRNRSRSDFLWVVGNRDKFNDEGVVPVHSTAKTILEKYKESDWKYMPLIKALTALSALFHDWGKSTALFQSKLKPNSKIKGDPIRHEWISCMLLHAFISQNQENWLERLSRGEIDEKLLMASVKDINKQVLRNLPSSAQLVLWLIVSHHKLPSISTTKSIIANEYNGLAAFSIEETLQYIQQSWGYENRRDEKEYQKRVNQCFSFPDGLLSNSTLWLNLVKRWANQLLMLQPLLDEAINDGSYRAVLHHSRLCLMLGDHNYSSLDKDATFKSSSKLYANTNPKTKELKQKLDEHLYGVYKSAMKIVHYLPMFEHESPFVKNNRVLKKTSPKEFAWQDKAVEKIRTVMDEASQKRGFFAVNMASTGKGKTFANAKVMQAISKDRASLRYVLALGLRTLTLQTGDEYRERIELESEDLAVLIGSKAIMELHHQDKRVEDKQKSDFGSESLESLLDEEVVYDCDIPEEGLSTILQDERDKKFLYAPVLVCTIDHLMEAVTTKKGGRYILPSLRMLSSDLVIDEIDDFSGSDLIAIGRLVHLAGMLGRGVMISSATIPPDLAEGYFNAYKKGWQLYVKGHDVKNQIVCAWIDEFKTEVQAIESFESKQAIELYKEYHNHFIEKRIKHLQKEPVKRKVEIVECLEEMKESKSKEDATKTEIYFSKIKEKIIQLHHTHHSVDKRTAKRISFGVVRVANIDPCVALSKFLTMAEYDDVEVKVMTYHSHQVLLLRHEQEKHLDAVLKRKEKDTQEPKAFKNEIIRAHIDNSKTKDIIFVLVATPVEEVGRDHDFDWAVIEPSSYRSIIQLAGRVQRHRIGEIEETNIGLMQYNYKAFKDNNADGKRYFKNPGYEENFTLNTHNISELIDTETIKKRLDASDRIKKSKKLDVKNSLVDLEHYVTQQGLTSYDEKGANSLQGYLDESWFLTAHPFYLHPFREGKESKKIFFVYNKKENEYYFAELDEYGNPIDREKILQISRADEDNIDTNRLWLHRDYNQLVESYASINNQTKEEVSLRYGELSFVIWKDDDAFEYSDQFGLVKI